MHICGIPKVTHACSTHHRRRMNCLTCYELYQSIKNCILSVLDFLTPCNIAGNLLFKLRRNDGLTGVYIRQV